MASTINRSAFAASSVGMLIVAARRSIRQLVAALVAPLDLTPHQYWVLLILQSTRPPLPGGAGPATCGWTIPPCPAP